jgi:two-component system sensor histidine kinase RegB
VSKLDWLVRLRWVAVTAQAAALGVAVLALGIDLPIAWLAAIIALVALTNGALAIAPRPNAVGPVLLFDTTALTAMLALAGGPSNPFSIVYLVHVTLAAVAVPGVFTWATVGLSAVGYGLLFVVAPGDPHAHHHHGGDAGTFSLHLQGMWIAFTVAAVLIAAFVTRVSRALETERENAARSLRLLGLTTLAAGAAHELATPLSTIKTVAGELERALTGQPELEALLADVRLVQSEVERSRQVLERLSLRAGELKGEAPEPVSLRQLAESVSDLPEALRARVDVRCAAPDDTARVPRRALAQVVSSLVRNALDGSGAAGRVDLTLALAKGKLEVEVRDHGVGMSPETLARAGEPFFTTKEPGRGMGLGLFLARTLVMHLGGSLDLESKVGEGTRVRIALPAVPA